MGSVIVRASPTVGGDIHVSTAHLKRYPHAFHDDDDDLIGMPDYVVAEQDDSVSSPPIDDVPEPTQMRTVTTTYEVESILDHKYRKSWLFLTKWRDWPVTDATWEPAYSFVHPRTALFSPIFVEYCTQHGLTSVLSSAKQIIQRVVDRVKELDAQHADEE